MVKYIYFLSLFALLGIFDSCSESPSEAELLSNKLQGTWEWKGSYGGLKGISIPADSFGYSVAIQFQNNNSARIYTNDTIEWEGAYHLYSRYNGNLIRFSNTVESDSFQLIHVFEYIELGEYNLAVKGDTIVFDPAQCADCYYQWFTKVY